MADWRDVMSARADADAARRDVDSYSASLAATGDSVTAFAVALVGLAVTSELRALGMIIDYTAREYAPLQ